MSLLASVKRGPTEEPIRIVLHGQEGVGKTTFAAGCKNVLGITAEDGGGDLDYARVVVPTWKGLRAAVWELIKDGTGDFDTLFIDTIDTYERLLWAQLCKEARCETIEEIGGGYGKGYTRAAEEMGELAKDLDELRSKRRMNVILLAHSHVKTFNDPLGNPFDRYEVRLHKQTSALWLGWADAILFAAFEVTVKTAKRNAAIDVKGKAESGRRVLYTTKDPAYDAKNRYKLPEDLPLSWDAFAKAMRWDERVAALRKPTATISEAKLPNWREFIADGVTQDDLSWTDDQREGFTRALAAAGLKYDEVAEWTAALDKGRPSQWPRALRESLWRDLKNGGRREFEAWLSQRAAS
jgi:hypothetical protein